MNAAALDLLCANQPPDSKSFDTGGVLLLVVMVAVMVTVMVKVMVAVMLMVTVKLTMITAPDS